MTDRCPVLALLIDAAATTGRTVELSTLGGELYELRVVPGGYTADVGVWGGVERAAGALLAGAIEA